MAQTPQGVSSIPNFSATPTSQQQFSQAIEEGPQKVATEQAATAQAKALKTQAELSQQQDSNKVLQGIIAPALSNPQVASSPQWQKLVQGKLKETGVQAPVGADGGIDVHALQAMVTAAPLPPIDAVGAAKLLEIPAGPARAALASLYNPSSMSPELLNAPLVPSQATILEAQKTFQQQLLGAQTGKMTPAAFIAGVNKDMLPYFGQSWEQVNRDPSVLAGLSASAQANIDKAVAAGVMDRAKAGEALSAVGKNASITDMNTQHAKLYGSMPAILNQREQVAYQRMQQNGQRIAAYVLQVNSNIDTAHNGSWSARQNLAQKDLGQLLTMKKDADVDVRQAYAMINSAKTNGNDYTTPLAEGQPSLLDSLTAALASAKAINQSIAAIKSPSLTVDAAQGVLRAAGGAGVTNNPEGSTKHATVVNTATDPTTGKKWNKLSDGTIVPAQ